MRLSYASFKNFRSIKDARIDFHPNCRILVGINESGKSNILRALSMLSPEVIPSRTDIREVSPDESPIDEAVIHFVFKLNNDDIDAVLDQVKDQVWCSSLRISILKKHNKKLTLRKFCEGRDEVIYVVNLLDGKKHATYWALSEQYEIEPNWFKPSETCPADFTIEDPVMGQVQLSKFSLLHNIDDSIPEEYLEVASPKDVNDLVGNVFRSLLKNSLPECVSWQYKEESFLPPRVNLSEFSTEPNVCEPLKSMFQLAGIENIAKQFEREASISTHGHRNLLHRVARLATEHLHNVWKEYASVSFELNPNGDFIDIGVKDQFTSFEFSQRSDGFKRFVTFLLLISAKVKTDAIVKSPWNDLDSTI